MPRLKKQENQTSQKTKKTRTKSEITSQSPGVFVSSQKSQVSYLLNNPAYNKAESFFDKEIKFSLGKKININFKPLLVLQGLAVFAVILAGVFAFGVDHSKKDINRDAIIKAVKIQKAEVAIAGEPVKWVATFDPQKVVKGRYLLEIPKDAQDVSIKALIGKQEINRYVAQVDQAQKRTLTLKDRRKLAKVFDTINSRKAGKANIGSAALSYAEGFGKLVSANVQTSFDDLLTKIKELTQQIDGKVIKLSDAKIIDLSKEIDALTKNKINAQIQLVIEYTTPAPQVIEKVKEKNTGKTIVVSSLEKKTSNQPETTNVVAYTRIPEIYNIGEEKKIQVKWKNNKEKNISFKAYDLNGNGKLDYLEWTVPHLSEQTFEVIYISKAFVLDSGRNVVEDIYSKVSAVEKNYASLTSGQFVRVTFAKQLDNTKDITVECKAKYENKPGKIEVYEKNGTKLIATIENIKNQSRYRTLLPNLKGKTDTFDLKIIGDVDIEYIVDPGAAYYWVGGSGTWNYNSFSHWSSSSGGGADMETLPTSSNDVFIDNNSGYAPVITVGGNYGHAYAASLNLSTYGIQIDLSNGTGTNLYVSGGLNINCTGSCSITSTGSGAGRLVLNGNSSISGDGGRVDFLTIANGGYYTRTTSSGAYEELTIDLGGYLNNQGNADFITGNNTTTINGTLGGSVQLKGYLAGSGQFNESVTVASPYSVIIVAGSSLNFNGGFDVPNSTYVDNYGNTTISGGTFSIGDSASRWNQQAGSVLNLDISIATDSTNGKLYACEAGSNMVFYGPSSTNVIVPYGNCYYDLNINAGQEILLNGSVSVSNTVGIGQYGPGTVFRPQGYKLTINGDLNVFETANVEAGSFNENYAVTGSVNLESGSTINYAASGAQDIDPITYKNLKLSGSGLKSLLSDNTVVTGVLTVDDSAELGGAYNLTISSGDPISFLGSGSLGTSATIILNAGESSGNSVSIPSGTYPNLTLTYGQFALSGGITVNGQLNMQGAYFTGNNNNLYLGSFYANAGTIYMGSGTWTLNDGGGYIWQIGGAANINKEGSQISISNSNNSNKYFFGGTQVYNNLTIDNGSSQVVFSGDNAWNNFMIGAGNNVSFAQGSSQVINGTLTANGTSESPIYLHSDANGSYASLQNDANACTTTVYADYLIMQDLHAINNCGGTNPWVAGLNSTNNGNNNGWQFFSCTNVNNCNASGGNGTCIGTDTCSCNQDYNGYDCGQFSGCPGNCNYDSGYGTCETLNGACTCNTNYFGSDCSTYCEASTTCSNNGTCNNLNGLCDCASSYYGASCSTYCDATGTCESHGTCDENGACACDSNYYGNNCSTYCQPASSCSNHGSCDANGSCVCDSGWQGADCSSPEVLDCSGQNNCSGHGDCIAYGVCACYEDVVNGYWNGNADCSSCSSLYYGADCLTYCDSGTCSGNGACNTDTGACDCYSNYYGTYCATFCDSSTCGMQGSCNTGSGACDCIANYYGTYCNVYCDASTTCSGNGSCAADGSCSCSAGWSGSDCSTPDYTVSIITPSNNTYNTFNPGFAISDVGPWSCHYSTDGVNYSNFSCSMPPTSPSSGFNNLYVKVCQDSSGMTCGDPAHVSYYYVNNPSFAGGTGISQDPYLISTCQQLQDMGYYGSYTFYKLSQDIDCSATSNWDEGRGFFPIPALDYGGLDGNKYKIKDLYINRTLNVGVGLISSATVSSFQKIGLSNVNINSTSNYVGGLAGMVSGSNILDCYVTGIVNGEYPSTYVGGLVGGAYTSGNNYGYIGTSYTSGTVSGFSYVGGLVGTSAGSTYIGNNFSVASVSAGAGTSFSGGLIGDGGGNVISSYFIGNNNAIGTWESGGISAFYGSAHSHAVYSGWDFANTWSAGTGRLPLLTQLSCSEVDNCSGHGECTAQNTCSCDSNYYGANCATFCDSGTCSNHGSCSIEGSCTCDTDYYGTDCGTYCSSATTCSGNGTCDPNNGSCLCESNYYGSGCGTYCNASTTCSNAGSCAADGSCLCDSNYYGSSCETYCVASTTCSSHGACDTNGACSCELSYYGTDCATYCDTGVTCNNNGSCNANGGCDCSANYYGAGCTIYCDANSCSGHGSCNGDPLCSCEAGWQGDTSCSSFSCELIPVPDNATCTGPNQFTCNTNYYPSGSCIIYCQAETTCSGHGTCGSNGACSCESGWAGDNCSEIVNPFPDTVSFTSISNTPDLVGADSSITFMSTASDTNASHNVTLYVCKANDFTGSACGSGGEWCHSDPAASDPSCQYTVQASDGTATQNYYAFIKCDLNTSASSNPRSGTFQTSVSGVTPSGFDPASDSVVDSTQAITFSLSGAGSCRASTSDKNYDQMSVDTFCDNVSTTNISCQMTGLPAGTTNVYIACIDYLGNKNSSPKNFSLAYQVSASANNSGISSSGNNQGSQQQSEANNQPAPTTQPQAQESTGGGVVQSVINTVQNTVGAVTNQIQNIIDIIVPQKPEPQISYPPIGESVTKETPIAFKQITLINPASLENFTLAPLPKSVDALISKFPGLKENVEGLGLAKSSDLPKFGQTSFDLPTLTSIIPALGQGVTLARLPEKEVEKIPTDVVFVSGAENRIGMSTKVSISATGEAIQTIKSAQGNVINLTLRPQEEAKKITGQVIFKSNQISKQSKNSAVFIPLNALGASVKGGLGLAYPKSSKEDLTKLAKTSSQKAVDLVLETFEYRKNNNGTYTASIQTPTVSGEYEIRTIIDYVKENAPDKNITVIAIIDPEGYVFRRVSKFEENRISGATVTIFELNEKTQKYEIWNAEEFLQTNPQITDITGRYSFLVPEGFYYIKVEHPSYNAFIGKPFEIRRGDVITENFELTPKNWLLGIFNASSLLISTAIIIAAIVIFAAIKMILEGIRRRKNNINI